MNKAEGREDPRDNFSGKGGRRDWSNRPGAATLGLGLILGLTLAGAQIMVSGRTGRYEKERLAQEEKLKALREAEESAVQLIAKVGGEGLLKYLGNKPTARYYLRETAEETTGFMALYLEPTIQQDGQWVLKGKQVYYDKEGRETTETFSVSNNLKWYEHQTDSRDLHTGQSMTIYQSLEEGLLRGYFNFEGSKESFKAPFAVQTQGKRNLIMPALLDFFSSVAAQEGEDNEVLLAVPVFRFGGGTRNIVQVDNLRVAPGGAAPAEVQAGIRGGHSVEVEYLEGDRFQTVFYDGEHQLVWQKDLPEPASFYRAVSREELQRAIPEAEQILNRLFRILI